MTTLHPRLVLAGLSGGAGKTILSLGLTRALARRGLSVRPFKKGPDYIDAAWLGIAAGRDACNLDAYLMEREILPSLFAERMEGQQVAVIEGNRGLYDGMDVEGSLSTADLARTLASPVVLVLDCTKMTRTAAAVVRGLAGFEEGVHLAGVVLNRTAGPRHRDILRRSIETHTDVPVLGALPRLAENPIPERHMGLTSSAEMRGVQESLDDLARLMEGNLDLDRILAIARAAGPVPEGRPLPWPSEVAETAGGVRLGVVRDAALWFYYPENIEALERAGAEIVELSILEESAWPELHGLYLGGGFPETLAGRIAANVGVRGHLRELAERGLPIYAECGGFMLLARTLTYGPERFPMAGVLPVDTRLCERPQGLGYVEAEVVGETPFHRRGTRLRGHEFHYSLCLAGEGEDLPLALKMLRGSGMLQGRDGLVGGGDRNVFASYTHVHALGNPRWAVDFVMAADAYRMRERSKPTAREN